MKRKVKVAHKTLHEPPSEIVKALAMPKQKRAGSRITTIHTGKSRGGMCGHKYKGDEWLDHFR